MDPNVQVAIATVIGTAITTLGIVVVALISRPKDDKEESKTAKEEAPLSELELIRALIMENTRHEATIAKLNERIAQLEAKENS